MMKLNKEQSEQLKAFIEQLDNAATVIEQWADEADADYDEKSESWQEGDKGTAYSEWKDQIRNCADEIGTARDDLQNLPEQPE